SSISTGRTKSAPFTSTSVTSTPSERNALATPRPVAMETSRSEPGPPISTAIFFGRVVILIWGAQAASLPCSAACRAHGSRGSTLKRRVVACAGVPPASCRRRQAGSLRSPELPLTRQTSSFLPHNLHFGFQFDPTRFPRGILDLRDQLQHLARARAAVVDDEVPVDLGNAGLPHPGVFQTQLIHQFSGRNTRRILEDATCALRRRLCRPTFLLRLVETALNLFRRRRPSFENRRDG